jgi:hypothetical protein
VGLQADIADRAAAGYVTGQVIGVNGGRYI